MDYCLMCHLKCNALIYCLVLEDEEEEGSCVDQSVLSPSPNFVIMIINCEIRRRRAREEEGGTSQPTKTQNNWPSCWSIPFFGQRVYRYGPDPVMQCNDIQSEIYSPRRIRGGGGGNSHVNHGWKCALDGSVLHDPRVDSEGGGGGGVGPQDTIQCICREFLTATEVVFIPIVVLDSQPHWTDRSPLS